MTHHLHLILAVAIISTSAGCHSAAKEMPPDRALSPVPAEATKVSQQIIVKFKPATIACNAQAISRFAIETRVRLEFLRPMSGNACVIVQQANNASSLMQEQSMLKHHPSIEWIEIDAMMQTH